MAPEATSPPNPSFLRKHPALNYFLLTFAVSWTAAFLVAAPKLLQSGPLPKLTGILMFPAMLHGPSFAGIARLCGKSLLARRHLRPPRGNIGRNRLDRLCLRKTAPTFRRLTCRRDPWGFLGALAHASD